MDLVVDGFLREHPSDGRRHGAVAVHRDRVGGATDDAERAADARRLVEEERDALLPLLRLGHAGDGAIVDDVGHVDEVDDVHRADVDAAAADDAELADDLDVEVALQAAVRFGDGLRGLVAAVHLEEQAAPLALRELRHLLPGDPVVVDGHVVVDPRELAFAGDLAHVVRRARAAERHDLVVLRDVDGRGDRIEVPRDLLRGGASLGDGLDDRRRAGAVVAGEEDGLDLGLERLRVDLHVAPALHAELLEVGHERAVGRLTERQKHGLARDLEFGALDRLGRTPAARVRIAEAVTNELHAAHVAARVSEDLDRRREVHELHPLTCRLAELLFVHDHLVAAPSIDDVDILGAQAPRGRRAVHRGVATTQDDDPLPHFHGAAAIRALEEHDPGHDALAVLTGDPDVRRLEAAGGHEHRVEALVQLAHLDVAADVGRHLQLDVLVHDPGDVAVDDLARQAERGHARERGPAGLVQRVVHGDAEAELREIARRGEAGAAGADDRDLLRGWPVDGRGRLAVRLAVHRHVLVRPVG